MATLISQVDVAQPADASAANTLANQVRAFKTQVKDLLLVIMNDNGTLKDGVLGTQSQLGAGTVGSTQLGDAIVDSQHIAADAIEAVHIADLAVLTSAIGDLAVTVGKLADGAVTAAKLATDAVETSKIKALAVTDDKIAAGTITSAKLAAVNGAKIDDDSITPAKFVKSTSGIRLPVINTAVANSKLATIGGALTATLVGDVLTFAIGGGVTENGLVATVGQTASGATSAAAYVDRTSYSRIRGEATLEIDGAHIKMLRASSYLVVYCAMGYSCGQFKVNLTNDTNVVKVTGTNSYAGPGQQAISYGCDLLTVAATNELYKLRIYAELTQAANGQGLLLGGGGGTDYTAIITFIGLS